MSRGKHVIVGHNETFAVGDHDFTKLSLIPDAILVHDISEDNTSSDILENEAGNAWENIGRWYQGQIYYGITEMALEGSSAIRGAVEIGNLIVSQGNVLPCLFAYTDGGVD